MDALTKQLSGVTSGVTSGSGASKNPAAAAGRALKSLFGN